jgi:hypothetical protein
MDAEALRAENEQLRLIIDEFRQREVADLRQQLAEARHLCAHYRAEADRNANLGRQIAAEGQQAIAELRAKLEAAQRMTITNVRTQR